MKAGQQHGKYQAAGQTFSLFMTTIDLITQLLQKVKNEQ
jgi:hypothetical protein